MTRTICVVQARMGSTRLPGKVLKDVSGKPSLQWTVDACKMAKQTDEVVVATSFLEKDDAIAAFCRSQDIDCFRGDEKDVLSRFMGVATEYRADILVRITGDCTFIDPRVIDEVVKLREMKDVAYATNTDPPTWPDGLDAEVFTRDALECAHREAIRGTDRDCVTRFIVRNRHRFPAANLVCPLPDLHRERWVLDSPEDYEFVRAVAERLAYTWSPPSYLDILSVLGRFPDIRKLNEKYSRNERFYEDLTSESAPKRSYALSQKCLAQAESIIPLGAQTFSKSKLMFPEGVAPLFLTHGDGGYCYDVDGNDYIDLVGGLLPNVLGYRDPDVDQAIREQLNRGITFSLATTLEEELAGRLTQIIPSAEMVRFAKNGSDVTTAAVRLARYLTGREEVVVHGYHGWHSWTTTNKNGVTLGEWDDSVHFNDKASVVNDKLLEATAAVIVEPEFFSSDELGTLRLQCNGSGTLLIFDEIITGFRSDIGGVQALTGVTPDLSTFGKAIANGMPLSALVGQEKYMKYIPEIAFSGTFFGEALSLAAGIATVDKLCREDVPKYLAESGDYLSRHIQPLLDKYKVQGITIFSSYNISRIKFSDKTLQSLFIQEMAQNGVLIIGSHNLCYAHKKPQLEQIVKAWDRTLAAIAKGAKLTGKPIQGKGVRE